MSLSRSKEWLIYYTLFHTIGYYSWTYYWNDRADLRTIGGNIFSFLAPLIASITLFYVYKKLKNNDKYFWLLIFLGCCSFVIAEAIWDYYENFLQVEVPFPGWADLFYMLQIVFYLLAFLYMFWSKRDHLQLAKFILDISIFMTVAISFSWHFIISDILSLPHVSSLFMFVSMGYPIGDLILILGAISFYLGSEYFFSPKVLFLIFSSLVVQVCADSAYLYLSANSLYFSGGPFDPLWSLALLLMGIAGSYSITEQKVDETLTKKNISYIKDFFALKLLLPYLSVIVLFVVMFIQTKQINSLIVGAAVAILLVILRQIFTLLENQTLLSNYHTLTEKLEQKIEERTIEISNKNQQLLTAVKKMKHMADHDVLSGLPNRRFFLKQLTIAMADAKRNSTKLAVVFIDLDRFKDINDTLGHYLGDQLLKYVSKQMLRQLRSIDTISRQGGDEFTLLLNKISSELEIIQLIKQIQSIVESPIRINGHELHVAMSMGIATYPGDGSTTDELLKHADMAMYSAKEEVGNSFKFYSPEMNETILRKIELENGLRKAINNDEFILHYQPQVNIETGKLIGVESLIRWNKAGVGMISPGEFIPLAEETRLIIPIGEWALYSACKQAKIWHDSGHDQLKLAINLSTIQFLNGNTVGLIASVLESTGFNPNFLEIEITETVALYDAEEAIKKMHALRNLGVRISIDDFGTGYSSLIYLKRFPINSLKIDQQFIKDIMTNESDKSLVKAMISMAHSLGLSVIAEGVETPEQLKYLQDLHCDEVQGYIYSKPISSGQFSEMLEMEIIPV